MDPVDLSLFASRISAICIEMGAQLQRAAFSPNIRDRLDYSCAVFDARGALCAQAAHIPVHLGSMAYAMGTLVADMSWHPGDVVIFNDPFLGGTHLPDVTVVSPVYSAGRCVGFVANRAHHADIGAQTPGSMPISTRLDQEGVVIPPQYIARRGRVDLERLRGLTAATRNARDAQGDFSAQISANQRGLQRLAELVGGLGVAAYTQALDEMNAYGERLAWAALRDIPAGRYRFRDCMDDDGVGTEDIPIEVAVTVGEDAIEVDFTGTALQVRGNLNCPLPVTAAAVYYAFRCLMPAHTPACAGSLRPIRIKAPAGSLLNARRPAAVAAGNVETSSRVVDVILGALAQALPERIPAASHGSMNNVAMGKSGPLPWGYYETIGGGMGAGPHGGGLSAVQTHMTNTRNTPVEVLEQRYPLRVRRYEVRRGSGGRGVRRGGDGLVREYEFLEAAEFTLITERRRHRPWGLAGGGAGQPGRNRFNGRPVPAKFNTRARPGDRLCIETAGGGGWGKAPPEGPHPATARRERD